MYEASVSNLSHASNCNSQSLAMLLVAERKIVAVKYEKKRDIV